jgi:hypothetical protein
VIAVAAVLAATLLTAGCAARPDAPRTAAAPATTSIAPVVTPSAVPGEITRSTFGGGPAQDPIGKVPQQGAGSAPTDEAIAVDVACSGTDGSSMTWSLVTGHGKPLGLSGDADCSGPASTSWLGVAEQRPATVRVALLPASGVVSGYAIVRLGTP